MEAMRKTGVWWLAALWLLVGCQDRVPAETGPPPPVEDELPSPKEPVYACPPSDTAGRVYYLAPYGDDAAPGTREAPWRSPGRAVRRLEPGDTLVILPGRYVLKDYPDDILFVPSGAEGRWITVCGPFDAPYPVLAGQDNLRTAIDVSGTSYVRLWHLEITHNPEAADVAFREGINGTGAPVSHLHLYDVYIHHLDQFGVDLADVDHLLIEHSRIEYTGFGAIGGPRGNEGGFRNAVIRYTRLSYGGHYYRGGDGSDRPYDRPDGFGIEASEGPIWLDHVVAEHNWGDGLDSKAARTRITNSVVANNWGDGVKLWGREGVLENVLIYGRGDSDPRVSPWSGVVVSTTHAGARFLLRHVTVDDALGQNYLMHVQYDHPDVPVELVLRNVIFSARGPRSPVFLSSETTLDAAGVLFSIAGETLLDWGGRRFGCGEVGELGPQVFCGDPGFRAPAWGETGDYHLTAGSAAIDAGVPAGVPRDLDGRFRDPSPDLGAYEYAGP